MLIKKKLGIHFLHFRANTLNISAKMSYPKYNIAKIYKWQKHFCKQCNPYKDNKAKCSANTGI